MSVNPSFLLRLAVALILVASATASLALTTRLMNAIDAFVSNETGLLVALALLPVAFGLFLGLFLGLCRIFRLA